MSPTLGVQRARCLSVCQSVCLYIYIYIIYIIRPSFLVPRPRWTDSQGGKRPASETIHGYGQLARTCYVIGASVSEPHLGSSTRPLSVSLSVCQSVCLYISYVRHFWSRGPRATRKRKPAHLKFKGHMHACCIILGECYALWGERERRAVVSVSNLRCWLSESCCRRSSLSL